MNKQIPNVAASESNAHAGPSATPLDERIYYALVAEGYDETDAENGTRAVMRVLFPPRVPLVWINDTVGYRCPSCGRYVCIPRREGATCPDCVAVERGSQPKGSAQSYFDTVRSLTVDPVLLKAVDDAEQATKGSSDG